MALMEAEQEELMRLLGSVAQGNRKAFQQLYERISGRMYGLCFKLAGQQELAEEALQDAFIRIWHHAGEYHSERGAPLSWMMTIARYRTLDLMRARKVRQTAGDDLLEHVEDERHGPLEASLHQAGSAALTGCLEELSEVQRDSILLSYYRGFTHDELAEALSSPIGTVKSWIRRGLIALKRCLER
ncbi:MULTISPECIES: RNA polymerase sigma factor [Marinobacter]|uniref:RNA polymerase subunit sigma n=1 Tax=Marinobacter profundi TaxID=2666256 RepID=A0A2G1ULK4_9GAMM|nr:MULTISPECIES: sigma-70 family RNA polymerase sigma factor [Marinobacter]MBD3658392.1 sigma-70 family RNA polymerase sigma factor [Marinobacter sp.]PHQ15319.1 RNA polymerase subunit sigma [Marinobacter profundi]